MAAKAVRKNKFTRKAEAEATGRSLRWWFSSVLWGVAGAAVLASLSLLCIFAYDYATQCDYFRAEAVSVSGCSRLDPETVREIAGAKEGVNILSVNLAAARKRLTADPWIKDAAIRRYFPSKMSIDIYEHEAVAIIDFGRLFLISTEGEIFKEYDRGGPEPLPLISGVAYRDWRADDQQRTRVFKSVMHVLQLGQSEKSIISKGSIEKIIVDKEIGLTLKLREPDHLVALGFDDYEKKIERFATIATHLERSGPERTFSLVDLKNPDRVVARPVSEKNIVAGKGGSSEGT